MRSSKPSAGEEIPGTGRSAAGQASKQDAGIPNEGGRASTSVLSLVVLSTPNQQEADAYCQQLPLHYCSGCDGCGLRCTEGIKMTRTEFLRIFHFLSDHAEELERVQAQDKSIPGWPVTKFCQFRDTEQNRCAIYPVRPVICRLLGHTEWLPCPLEIVPPKGQKAMDVYQRYAAEELRTFDEWRRDNQQEP